MALKFRPKLDKIVELLLYLAHRKPGADKYQAVKFLYLADREHLNRFGRPITFETYYALKYGPVASSAKDFIERKTQIMREAGLTELPFATRTIAREGPEQTAIIELAEPRREVDFALFSKSDIRVFDEILERYGNYDFDQLYELTHEHYAYERAWADRGFANRSLMDYAEMIDSKEQRDRLVADIGAISSHM